VGITVYEEWALKKLLVCVLMLLAVFGGFTVDAGQKKPGFQQDPVALSPDAIVPPVAAAGAGGISGRVTNMSGSGLTGVYVKAVSASGWTYSTLSDSAGNYLISAIPSGNYIVHFGDYGNNSCIWEYFNDRHTRGTGDVVAVLDDMTKTGVDAQLETRPVDPLEPNNDRTSATILTAGIYNNLVIDDWIHDYDWFRVYLEEGQDLLVRTVPYRGGCMSSPVHSLELWRGMAQ